MTDMLDDDKTPSSVEETDDSIRSMTLASRLETRTGDQNMIDEFVMNIITTPQFLKRQEQSSRKLMFYMLKLINTEELDNPNFVIHAKGHFIILKDGETLDEDDITEINRRHNSEI